MGFTLRIEVHTQPHSTGDQRVISHVIWHKVVLLFGGYGQHMSVCREKNTTSNKTNQNLSWINWFSALNRGSTHPCSDRCSWPAPCCRRCSCTSSCRRRNSGPRTAPTWTYRCSEGSDWPLGQPAVWPLMHKDTETIRRTHNADRSQSCKWCKRWKVYFQIDPVCFLDIQRIGVLLWEEVEVVVV